MSNQAHKNRLRGIDQKEFKEAKNKGRVLASEQMANPKLNPAGKMNAVSSPSPTFVLSPFQSKNPKSIFDIKTKSAWKPNVSYKPDPAASSRGANVRANKERGTQSSTQRKVIK